VLIVTVVVTAVVPLITAGRGEQLDSDMAVGSVQLMFTVPWNPPLGVTVTWAVPDCPGAEMVYSGNRSDRETSGAADHDGCRIALAGGHGLIVGVAGVGCGDLVGSCSANGSGQAGAKSGGGIRADIAIVGVNVTVPGSWTGEPPVRVEKKETVPVGATPALWVVTRAATVNC